MAITHTFVCAIADDAGAAAAGEVVPSNWNADHAVTSLVIDSTGTGSMDVILNDTAGVTGTGGYDWKLLYDGGAAWSNGPIGEPNYIDDVWTMGIGIGSTVGTRASGKASLAITMESKYYSGPSATSPWSEFHIEAVDTSDVRRRMLSFAVAHDGSEVNGSMISDSFSFTNAAGVEHLNFDFAGSNSVVYLNQPTTFEWADNNVPMLKQRNAADSAYLNLPYIASDDRFYCQLPGVFVGATPTAGSYANIFFALTPTSGVHGGAAFAISGPSIDGGYNFISLSGSYKWDAQIVIYNSYGSSGATARYQASAVAGGADPCSLYRVNGVTDWCVGLDNSDSDSFTISKYALPGYYNALRIDTSLNAKFYGSLGVADATNGQACDIKTLTELLTIAAAATSTTTIQKPANSLILGVSVRVTTAVTCTSTFTVGDSGSAARFSTAAVSKAVNSTDKGTAAGCYYNATAEGIVITPDTVPSDATGRVRVTIHYIEMTPPTS